MGGYISFSTDIFHKTNENGNPKCGQTGENLHDISLYGKYLTDIIMLYGVKPCSKCFTRPGPLLLLHDILTSDIPNDDLRNDILEDYNLEKSEFICEQCNDIIDCSEAYYFTGLRCLECRSDVSQEIVMDLSESDRCFL